MNVLEKNNPQPLVYRNPVTRSPTTRPKSSVGATVFFISSRRRVTVALTRKKRSSTQNLLNMATRIIAYVAVRFTFSLLARQVEFLTTLVEGKQSHRAGNKMILVK